MASPLAITFDTNIPALPAIRAFWATLCEDAGQQMTLVPTAATELLRRVRLETEREWAKRLKAINAEQRIGWTKVEVRRLSTTASNATRDWLREEMGRQGAIYAVTKRASPIVEETEAELEDILPEDIFDMLTDNGIRDRKIVVEALARGFSILASNNIDSIDHELLKEWIVSPIGRRMNIKTTILRPPDAEARLRQSCGKSTAWTLHALARASVTDPYSPGAAAEEMALAMKDFPQRGMVELRGRIERMMLNESALEEALQSVRSHGASLAQRANARMAQASAKAVSKEAGISLDP